MKEAIVFCLLGVLGLSIGLVSYLTGFSEGEKSKPVVKCDDKCRCKLPQIFIDENTDIPNNPLKPMTVEEFQKLRDELRKRSKPEVGDGL